MSWKTICSPLEAGGLGIKDIDSFNDTLLPSGSGGLGSQRRAYGEMV